jgi:hypothetical protein
MKPWKPAALTLTCLALAACNSSDNSVPVSSGVSQALTYELSENGCNTGRHTFPSFTELCVGLQNNTLNNECALNLRAEHFRRNCQGQSFSPFDAPVGDPSGDPNYPGFPDPGYPSGPSGGGRADIQVSGFRNLYFRLDSSQGAGSVACYINKREFRLELDHPEFANLGAQSRLLSLNFQGRGKRFPSRVEFGPRASGGSLSALLPGVDRPWEPRRENCEVELNRQGQNLEASFDCRLDGRQQGRSQAIRMRATVNCQIERR